MERVFWTHFGTERVVLIIWGGDGDKSVLENEVEGSSVPLVLYSASEMSMEGEVIAGDEEVVG